MAKVRNPRAVDLVLSSSFATIYESFSALKYLPNLTRCAQFAFMPWSYLFIGAMSARFASLVQRNPDSANDAASCWGRCICSDERRL